MVEFTSETRGVKHTPQVENERKCHVLTVWHKRLTKHLIDKCFCKVYANFD
jgi:hypothetical protein